MTPQCAIPLPKRNFCQFQQKTPEKQKLKLSRSALFQPKTRVSLRYPVTDCRLYDGARPQCLTHRSSFLFINLHELSPSPDLRSDIPLKNQLGIYISYSWSSYQMALARFRSFLDRLRSFQIVLARSSPNLLTNSFLNLHI